MWLTLQLVYSVVGGESSWDLLGYAWFLENSRKNVFIELWF